MGGTYFGKKSQAERIIEKFGGARRLACLLNALGRPVNPATVYKWTYSPEKGGRGGVIPPGSLKDVMAVARAEGILLTSEDLDPRPR